MKQRDCQENEEGRGEHPQRNGTRGAPRRRLNTSKGSRQDAEMGEEDEEGNEDAGPLTFKECKTFG